MRLFALPIFNASGHNETSSIISAASDDEYSESSSFFYHLMLIVGGSSTMCCIIANMLTVFVLIRHRPLQKSISNLYILSLSVADLFIGLTVMFPMIFNEIKNNGQFGNSFFGPEWICKGWQLFDFIFSTISLYSTCSIAFDRVWNLEKPLRVFKRSRRLAKRLIMIIWLLPILIWSAVFFFILEPGTDSHDGCLMSRNRAHLIPLIAIPVLYIPALILILMFVRISLVVHRHLKFLREHSSVPQLNSNSPQQERNALSVNSINRDCNSSLRAPDFQFQFAKKSTYESLTTVTSGYCTTTLRTPRSNSPWFPRSTEFQLAPLSEEKSSGRERSQSEQINLTPEVQNSLKIADSRSHSKIDTSFSVPTRRESIVAKQLLLMQRAEAFFHRKPSAESIRLARATSCRSRYSSSDSTGSSVGGPIKILRKFSNLSRASSKRFSVIAIHSNLADLLHREGVSHQVKAAKAVALITCCFLLCWFPFLIVWPLKIYCHDCVPDNFYRWCVWLNYLCSAINPILYTLSSPRVRSALKKYINFASYGSKMRKMKAASFYKSNTLV